MASNVVKLFLLDLLVGLVIRLVSGLKYLLRILVVLAGIALFHHLHCSLINVDLSSSWYSTFCRFLSFGGAALYYHYVRYVTIFR